MNKLYLLAALGLASSNALSNGWYAGDCFDESDFTPNYGYVAFDCGDNCETYQVGYYSDYYDYETNGDSTDVCDCTTDAGECGYYGEDPYYGTVCIAAPSDGTDYGTDDTTVDYSTT